MSRMFAFMSAVVTVQGSVGMFVVYRELLKVVGFLSRCEVICVVYLYSGCDGYCAFCLTCDACNCKCFCMGRMLVYHPPPFPYYLSPLPARIPSSLIFLTTPPFLPKHSSLPPCLSFLSLLPGQTFICSYSYPFLFSNPPLIPTPLFLPIPLSPLFSSISLLSIILIYSLLSIFFFHPFFPCSPPSLPLPLSFIPLLPLFSLSY